MDSDISERFSIRTIFLGNIFFNVICLIFPEFRVPDPDSLFVPQSEFYHKMNFDIIFWFTYQDGRFWWQVYVHSGQHSWAGALVWLTVLTRRRVTMCDRLCVTRWAEHALIGLSCEYGIHIKSNWMHYIGLRIKYIEYLVIAN